ncbi:tRNA dihydrouridine synthase DusB [Candidatus Gracilibacteria bacterium]|nr:tRNA dihydrouridine synthase DusB [Candidatus Gracilibacteria bacterium]
MQSNFWQDLDRPILVLAPMAGYTESPFRRMIREIEPSVVLVSELISAEALRRKNEKTMRLVAFHKSEKKYFCIQIFGSKAESFLESAKVIEELGADGIDLNLGCPSPKIVNSGNGSALLRDPLSTTKLIESLVKSTKLPVSVKMRLGFYDDSDLIEVTKNFASAGIASLAIHGRTTKQKFEGNANWEKIYEVKENLKIPVIGNGDITTAEEAKEKLQNLDGIMIGRATFRNPWIFKQCREAFNGEKISEIPSLKEQLKFLSRQAKLSVEFKGEKWAMMEIRKHLAHFVRSIPGAAEYRDKLIKVSTLAEMEGVFKEIPIDKN